MTCNVTGTAISPNGQIKPGAKITFRRAQLDVVSQEGSFVIPDDYIIQTASDGTVDFDILPGVYDATTVAVGGRTVAFRVSVPDEPAADFADLLNASYVEIPPASVTQAQQARDAAIAARDVAVAARDEALLYDGPKVDTFAELASVTPTQLAVGEYIRVIANGAVYRRVSTGGDLDYTGSGGVRLSVVNEFRIDHFGAAVGGVIDCQVAAQKAVDAANALYLANGQRQSVIVPPGIWGFASPWLMKSGVTVICHGTIKWIGPNTAGHFVFWGGTDGAEFIGGLVDCNNIGNTNGIAIGGSTVNTSFYVRTRVINCIAEPTAPKYSGGGKAVTLQHGALSGVIDVIATNGSIGISTEGISAQTGLERAARNVRVKMVCENMTQAGWVGQGSLNGGVNGSATYMRNHSLDLDLTLINCGLDGVADSGPIITQMATHTRANIRIQNTSARTPAILRGTHRALDLRVQAMVSSIKDVIDTNHVDFGGFGEPGTCLGSRLDIDVVVENAGATGSILTGNASSILRGCDVTVGIVQTPNTVGAAFDLSAANTALIHASTRFEVINRSSGTGGIVYGQTTIGGGRSLFWGSDNVPRLVSGTRASETAGQRVIVDADTGLTTVADDTAVKFTPASARGAALLSVWPSSRRPILIGWDMTGVGAGPRIWAQVFTTAAGATNTIAVLDGASSTALTGTTGTDGNVTISASAGVVYIENRSGAGLGVQLRPLPDAIGLSAV